MVGNNGISKKSLAEQAADEIEKRILTGEIKPGEHLIEERLVKELGVSRGPIRDAFLILQNIGLVNNIPYKGTSVIKAKKSKAKELSSLLELLKSYAIELCIQHDISSEGLEDMQKEIIKKREAYNEDDVIKYTECEDNFHKKMIDLTGNELLKECYMVLRGKVLLFQAISFRERDTFKCNKYLKEQEEQIQAIKEKDKELALEVLENTYKRWGQELMGLLEED